MFLGRRWSYITPTYLYEEMTVEDVEACMGYFYRFEANGKEEAAAVERWLVTGWKQDLSKLERAGVLKVNHGNVGSR